MPSSNPTNTSRKKPADHKKPQKRYGSTWKKPLTDLELPSGELCQVKRPGVQGLIKAGVLHSMDTLTSIVQGETIPKAQGKSPVDVKAIINDPERFSKMMEVVDKIVIHVVVEPKVVSNLVPVLDEKDQPVLDNDNEPTFRELEDDERDENLIYVDYIDQMDKMYIMNFAVGGSADLAQFRQETEAFMGGIPDVEATAEPTK